MACRHIACKDCARNERFDGALEISLQRTCAEHGVKAAIDDELLCAVGDLKAEALVLKALPERGGEDINDTVKLRLGKRLEADDLVKAAWEMTDMFHLEAIKLLSTYLRGAVKGTKEGREGMALGQYIAGMGFSNVGLGIAHSMAHTLGAVYDTPHGVACAMMLPIVMEYNADCTGEKYREIARAMGVEGVDSMTQAEYRRAAIDAVKRLSKDVGIPEKLDALKEEDLPFLAESAYADACRPGNPKDTNPAELTELFRKLM